MIRIIGGNLRGRKLKVPPGNKVRPTPDRVREALFSMLEQLVEWNGLTVLDLYAGSGALGLEALSRGAERTVFVDVSRQHIETIRQNIETCGIGADRVELVCKRAENWIRNYSCPGSQCLVFIDPPYRNNNYALILSLLSALPAIPSSTWIVVESPREIILTIPDGLSSIRRRTYGSVSIELLQKR